MLAGFDWLPPIIKKKKNEISKTNAQTNWICLTNSSLYYQVNSFVFIPCSSSCCLFFSFFFYCCFIPDDIIIITRHFGNLLSVSSRSSTTPKSIWWIETPHQKPAYIHYL
jgi:hypothetical protein